MPGWTRVITVGCELRQLKARFREEIAPFSFGISSVISCLRSLPSFLCCSQSVHPSWLSGLLSFSVWSFSRMFSILAMRNLRRNTAGSSGGSGVMN